jgi:hypothetical protein
LVVSAPGLAVDLHSATAQDINRAVDAGTLTAKELVRRCKEKRSTSEHATPTVKHKTRK